MLKMLPKNRSLGQRHLLHYGRVAYKPKPR
jgi:hypothetical protein